jgi:hypothetical protein
LLWNKLWPQQDAMTRAAPMFKGSNPSPFAHSSAGLKAPTKGINSMDWPTSVVDGSFWIRPVIILLHHACNAGLSGRSRLLLHISSKRQNDDYLSFKYRFGTIWIESGRASWHISNRKELGPWMHTS